MMSDASNASRLDARATRGAVYAPGRGHIGLMSTARTRRLVARLVHRHDPEISIAAFHPNRYR